jgi:Domain of Unknown Function with PDB structure (DUF3857)/Transglutaminase-like superfamily
MSASRLAPAVGLILLALPFRCIAAGASNPVAFDQIMSKWTVEENGTWTVDAEVAIRAPRDNPSHVVRLPLTWSASMEKLDVVQARIDKPDGHSVVMPGDALREDPPSGDRYFHEFTDEHRLIITFSDVQTGDLLAIRTHREVFRPRVPGGFMAAPVLDQKVGWDETNFTISVPSDMPFHVELHGFDEQSELIKDRVVHYLHSPKIAAPPREIAILGPFDRLPRFAVSTFRDWDEFGKAYASVLLPHAKVSPAIAAMAAKLTAGKTDERDQARALYYWVRDNINHIPIPLEESRPDPHDAEQVMSNLYGDDKDHVVLLYALLAARGIPAEIVLLNASNTVSIADPPNFRPMDHLILFLPRGNVYIDSTVAVAPFGVLPFTESGKPAIHLGGSGLARREIPIPAASNTTTELKTVMTFAADGTVSGSTKTTARGAFGILLRRAARSYGTDRSGAAATLLRTHGIPGTGTLSFDSPTAPGLDYTVQGSFQLENMSALLHGGFFGLWTGLRILPRPGDVLGGPMFMRDLLKDTPTFCFPGIQSEEISLTIPEGRELGSIPPDEKIDTDQIRYRSHWTLDGRRVTVSREFYSIVSGPVCEGMQREEMADILTKVRSDVVTPVGFRQDELPERPVLVPKDEADR